MVAYKIIKPCFKSNRKNTLVMTKLNNLMQLSFELLSDCQVGKTFIDRFNELQLNGVLPTVEIYYYKTIGETDLKAMDYTKYKFFKEYKSIDAIMWKNKIFIKLLNLENWHVVAHELFHIFRLYTDVRARDALVNYKIYDKFGILQEELLAYTFQFVVRDKLTMIGENMWKYIEQQVYCPDYENLDNYPVRKDNTNIIELNHTNVFTILCDLLN